MKNVQPKTETTDVTVDSVISQVTTQTEALSKKITVLCMIVALYGDKDFHLLKPNFLKGKLDDLANDIECLSLGLKRLLPKQR